MNSSKKEGKTLIAYFSASGITAGVARKLAAATGAELLEIKPVQPYSAADLDWRDKKSRSTLEMTDPSCRPAILDTQADLSEYSTIYIGYPIWWGVAPRPVNTFIESHDLRGKALIPFATSGASPVGHSVEDLRKTYPDLDWKEGKLLNHLSDKEIEQWTEAL